MLRLTLYGLNAVLMTLYFYLVISLALIGIGAWP
jgi:hypothetical protein